MLPTPDIDFTRIRPYGQPASRANAFEELASLLIRSDVVQWPEGTRFDKFGNPDGGREGRGVLPDGEVWAWQAKYLTSFGSGAVQQVTKSFQRTLNTEPKLRRYFVIMPIDLPAGDTDRAKSAATLWAEAVDKWKALAAKQNRIVTIEFLGAHDLISALTLDHNAGRVRYWFDESVLTQDQQQIRINEIAAKLGRRYSPQLHVDVEAVQLVDGAGRTTAYITRWQQLLADLRSARRKPWWSPDGEENLFREALLRCDESLKKVDAQLERIITLMHTFNAVEVLTDHTEEALSALDDVETLLRRRSLAEGGFYVGRAASLYWNVRNATSTLIETRQLCLSPATAAAIRGELLLTGRAGVGKTHLLCDISEKRIAAGLPTIMLLGQDFDIRNLLTQIPELAEFPGTLDELLALLNAAAEASERKALLVIDAINESEKPDRWSSALRAMKSKASRYPAVSLVISCRTEFVDTVAGDHGLPAAEHFGFEESTETAIRRFATEYALDVPTFPVLSPEFENPLFLRLTCEALKTLGTDHFTLGSAGLTTACRAFINAANVRLSAASRCDFDPRTDLVNRAIQQLATIKGGRVPRGDANDICSTLLPDRSWSKSLLKGMLDEGVLIEVGTDHVSFGYQRLGDVARAKIIAETTPIKVTEWIQSLGTGMRDERGVLGALAVLMPEQHGMELLDCFDHRNPVPYDLIDAFLESIALRKPSAVGSKTKDLVIVLLKSKRHKDKMWRQLMRVACIPDHPLNAQWLHKYLLSLDLPTRDASWSLFLVGALEAEKRNHSPIRTLIDWAWPATQNAPVRTNGDTAELALLLLGWCTSTTDRRVRDHATKALVSLGEREVSAFTSTLPLLMSTNDPYVTERMAAAACGIALRQESRASQLAVPLANWVACGWPRHFLTRDYLRRVFGIAKAHGWDGPDGRPPYGAPWPIETTPRGEIEQLTSPPACKYGSIWRSLTGMGDFGRYIIKPALQKFFTEDHHALQATVEEAIFDRVQELGWTPAVFDEIDNSLSRNRRAQVERIGKKYQWIGFYEMLGAASDNLLLDDYFSSGNPYPYAYAEQLIWRDIDVTVLAREPKRESSVPHAPWFSPRRAEFPREVVNDYPSNLDGVPDPLDLLAITAPDGGKWVTLLNFPKWKQPHPPEILALKPPIRYSWMQIRTYIIPIDAADRWQNWTHNKDWYGRWMPELTDVTNALLGAHPTAPEWATASGSIDGWNSNSSRERPSQLLQSGAWYGGTGSDRDASATEETRGFVPSRKLFELLELRSGTDFVWRDNQGVAVFDPAPSSGRPNGLLMRRELLRKIQDAGHELFWTVLVGHENSVPDHGFPKGDYQYITASASYRVNENRITLIHSLANLLTADSELSSRVPWSIKAKET